MPESAVRRQRQIEGRRTTARVSGSPRSPPCRYEWTGAWMAEGARTEAPPMTGQQPPDPAPVDTTGMADQPRRTDPQPDLLLRHASRTLDPVTAVRFHDQRLEPTVYAGAQLLVRPTADEDAVLARLTEVADAAKLDLHLNPVDERMRQLAREAGIGPDEPQPLILPGRAAAPLGLRAGHPAGRLAGAAVVPRTGSPRARRERAAVQLDHLLTSHSEGTGREASPATRTGRCPARPATRTGSSRSHRQPRTGSARDRLATRTGRSRRAPATRTSTYRGGVAEYARPGLGRPDAGRLGRPEPVR